MTVGHLLPRAHLSCAHGARRDRRRSFPAEPSGFAARSPPSPALRSGNRLAFACFAQNCLPSSSDRSSPSPPPPPHTFHLIVTLRVSCFVLGWRIRFRDWFSLFMRRQSSIPYRRLMLTGSSFGGRCFAFESSFGFDAWNESVVPLYFVVLVENIRL